MILYFVYYDVLVSENGYPFFFFWNMTSDTVSRVERRDAASQSESGYRRG